MDFDLLAKSMGAMTCVLSVEKLPGDKCGEIRIVSGNDAYIDSIEKPIDEMVMKKRTFVPNQIYTNYLTKDLNFENACYQAAINRKMVHSYVRPDRFDVWLNMVFMPLMINEGNIYYCTYSMEVELDPNSENISDISADIASSVLETCVVLRKNNDFEESMHQVVHTIRKMCASEMCVVLRVDTINHFCSVLGESRDKDSKLSYFKEHVSRGFYDIVATWEDTISGSNCLILKNDNDMEILKENNYSWYESLINEGIHSLIIFPLKSVNDVLLGYIWASNFDANKADKIKETLEITTFILSSDISNYLLVDRLKTLSSRDMLTGVLNRNEMNNVVDKCANSHDENIGPLGVIFADLNGLKAVNDIDGHASGDTLLKDAASVLTEVFDDDQIFRAGGDEFCIIVAPTDKDEILRKIELVRKYSKKYEKVSFALGSSVVDKSSDIRIALKNADLDMYMDKKRYYDAHPDKKRQEYTDRLFQKRV